MYSRVRDAGAQSAPLQPLHMRGQQRVRHLPGVLESKQRPGQRVQCHGVVNVLHLVVADIAASVHLTTSHAMTVFRRAVVAPLGDYVTMCRVAVAQRLLLTISLKTTEIAGTAGFGSLSSFYDHVTAACRMTLREY